MGYEILGKRIALGRGYGQETDPAKLERAGELKCCQVQRLKDQA